MVRADRTDGGLSMFGTLKPKMCALQEDQREDYHRYYAGCARA